MVPNQPAREGHVCARTLHASAAWAFIHTHLAVLGGGRHQLLAMQALQAGGLSGPPQLPRLIQPRQLLKGGVQQKKGR